MIKLLIALLEFPFVKKQTWNRGQSNNGPPRGLLGPRNMNNDIQILT